VETGTLAADRLRIPTPQPAVPEAVAEVIGEIASHFEYTGLAGITFPGVVKNGTILSAANVDKSWINADGGALFSPHVGGAAHVVNDADAAGFAEVQFGAGRDQPGVVILLTFGTGIGSAVFVDGILVPNTEFGHLQIRGKDAEKRAAESIREEKNLSWKKWAKEISVFLDQMEILFSPDLFIIGGGVSKKADKFIPHIKTKQGVPIVPAKMQNQAGIIGAAYLARNLAK
jgi:polyphosphate glucokinase